MEKGYKILRGVLVRDVSVSLFTKMYSIIRLLAKDNKDLVSNEDGSVVQVRNLQNRPEFVVISEFIEHNLGYKGEVLDMQYLVKHPRSKGTKPHQDAIHYGAEDNILTFWIPLQDTSKENSTICYYDWNQSSEILPHSQLDAPYKTNCEYQGNLNIVDLKLGDVAVHNQFVVHSTSDNNTEEMRIAIVCVLKIKK